MCGDEQETIEHVMRCNEETRTDRDWKELLHEDVRGEDWMEKVKRYRTRRRSRSSTFYFYSPVIWQNVLSPIEEVIIQCLTCNSTNRTNNTKLVS
jgi:hypothetical protein